ncbi:hypothetical protein [Romboutsia lituseburensis]|uniref:hypothetical protein n=1 Tax=Romboutsia lituseburensis TaxID=1537 RepID=UPI00215AB71E|nr:hypothetical protein [Romboutsia lituseburensis]MCR8747223.1 hypothetical protein [Romboutsia lituseburensis]
MIIDINTGKEKKGMPHSKNFYSWMKALPSIEYDKIVETLNDMIDGDEVHTAGWMPGSNWIGTVFEPIFLSLGKNEKKAALFFGLIVYKVFMDREDVWACGRFELNGKSIGSLTYFRVNI